MAAVAVLVPPTEASEEPPVLDVLFTAETGRQPLPCRCKTYPLGGWAQRFAVLDSLRSLGTGPLLVDAGGWLGTDVPTEVAALTAEAHARMGYDAMNVGAGDLAILAAGAAPGWIDTLPLVCGHPARPHGIPPFRVVERGGRHIGLVGAASLEESGAPTPAQQVATALSSMPQVDVVVVLLDGGLGPVNLIGTMHARAHVILYGDGARTPSPLKRRYSFAAAPGSRGRYVGHLVVPRLDASVADCPYALVPVDAARRGPDELVHLALRAADRLEGTEAFLEATFDYTE